ncbi:MAG: zinc-dependent metalloprotease, partial [Flavobacteriaceae bacterium]|nr:zinc-dependent metalloprotease [Flavobacteriaceae bacterium]
IALIFLMILFLNQSIAQEICGTTTNSTYQKFSSLSRMLFGNSSSESNICLNAYFHVVRDDNGIEDNLLRVDVIDIISKLNQDYATHNISFNNSGSDYIDNSTYLDIIGSEFNDLININNVQNAINIYLVNSATFLGKANGILSQSLVIMKEYSATGIISHEMGHCLNLYHTHETQFGVENEDNCTYAGDLLCDTPIDPGLKDNVNSTCQYVGGGVFTPDTKNIMSYSPQYCLEHFSNGQAIRMRDAILNSPILQNTINCNCSVTALFGKTTISNSETTTYTVSCGNASFITSSNLQTISTTANSITVKPINTSINDVGFIKATINGVVFQKDIWIGKPKVDVTLTPDINYVFLELVGVNSDVHKQNISYIEWETLSTTGSANMGTAINSFENLAHGNSTNWIINAKIKVVNDSGTTYLYKDITPPAPLPCDDYFSIIKTSQKEYAAFNIIDPCAKSTINNTIKEKVKDKDITEAKLFDLYGNKVKTYNLNNFNVTGLKQGIYIFKIKINDIPLTQKIIVE